MAKSSKPDRRTGVADVNLSRRTFGIGLTLSAIAGCNRATERRLGQASSQPTGPDPRPGSGLENETERRSLMPVGFVGHGAPTLAFDRAKGADLQA